MADEQVSLAERKAVAEHLIQLVVDAEPVPGDDHAEVMELRTPWTDDGPLGSIAPMAWKQRNISYGWSADGPTLAQARKRVHDRLKLRTLLAVMVDEAAHRLERVAACQAVLHDHSDPHGFHRKNDCDAEKLLDKVLPPTATKFGGWNEPRVPVVRPPQCLADVWES